MPDMNDDRMKREAVDEPKSGSKLYDVHYDRATDIATVWYEDGENVAFPGCRDAQFGFGLVVERNSDGTFGQRYMLLDDANLHILASMSLGQKRGVFTEDGIKAIAGRTALDDAERQFRQIGIPATFRRLGMRIIPHLESIEDPCDTLPAFLTDDMVDRLEAGDFAFRDSIYHR